MPFVNLEHRLKPDFEEPGDRCYIEYSRMMTAWRESPRWRMVDAIAAHIWPDRWKRAMILAFLVFFALHVLPYEAEKRRLNGDI
jgi:hypothetical protein